MAKSSTIHPINGVYKGKDIISLGQFSKKDLALLFSYVPEMADIATHAKPIDLLQGTLATLLFYEPSTRTRSSFDAAVKQLGGQTIVVENPQQFSSVVKGETFEDTIRVFEAYCDVIVLRHPEVGSATQAAETAQCVPIINAGDGIGEHPTQGLLDLYTIYERFKTLNNLTVVFAGDMRNGRTIHSLLYGLSLYKNITCYLLSSERLTLPEDKWKEYETRGLTLKKITSEEEIPRTAHVWYWTRVQKERFTNLFEYEKVKNRFSLTKKLLDRRGNNNLIIMHPLPRVGDIERAVDDDDRASYLRSQIRNGMYVRMALVALVLGKLV